MNTWLNRNIEILLIILWFRPDLPTHKTSCFSSFLLKYPHHVLYYMQLNNVKASWVCYHLYPNLICCLVKIGPLASYYQVPLRHILLVLLMIVLWWSTITSHYRKLISWLMSVSPYFVWGLWWHESAQWCTKDSKERWSWSPQWVIFRFANHLSRSYGLLH